MTPTVRQGENNENDGVAQDAATTPICKGIDLDSRAATVMAWSQFGRAQAVPEECQRYCARDEIDEQHW